MNDGVLQERDRKSSLVPGELNAGRVRWLSCGDVCLLVSCSVPKAAWALATSVFPYPLGMLPIVDQCEPAVLLCHYGGQVTCRRCLRLAFTESAPTRISAAIEKMTNQSPKAPYTVRMPLTGTSAIITLSLVSK